MGSYYRYGSVVCSFSATSAAATVQKYLVLYMLFNRVPGKSLIFYDLLVLRDKCTTDYDANYDVGRRDMIRAIGELYQAEMRRQVSVQVTSA